jgi:hypothetical protein
MWDYFPVVFVGCNAVYSVVALRLVYARVLKRPSRLAYLPVAVLINVHLTAIMLTPPDIALLDLVKPARTILDNKSIHV